MQGSQKDQYVKKLRNIVEKGTKCQDTLIEVTPNSGSAEINYWTSVEFETNKWSQWPLEAFIKEQRDFNKNIKSHISSNSIEISECTIEVKDLEQKSKNQAKEVKLSSENHIQAVKDEIGEEVQKLAKQIANLSSKLSSDLKTLKTKASSTEDSIKHILQQLNDNNKSSVYIWTVTYLTVTRNKPSRPCITTFNGNSGLKWVHVHSSYVKQVWNSSRGKSLDRWIHLSKHST